MIHELVRSDHPILRQKMEPFDFTNPPTDPVQLARDLTETMIHNKGLGLSANQIGLPYRVFALSANPVYVCFNPRIVDETELNIVLMDEGCLSFPNLFLKIKRPRTIKVRFVLPNGETQTQKFDGMTARCFQHELDHLNGIVYTDRVSTYHLDRGMNKKKQIDRAIKKGLYVQNQSI